MTQSPTLHLQMAPLDLLDSCDKQKAFKEDTGDGKYYIYHLCTCSELGTEGCLHPAKMCRVKEEDDLFAEYVDDAAKKALAKITHYNLKEGKWREVKEV
jgi:hypothetical protein